MIHIIIYIAYIFVCLKVFIRNIIMHCKEHMNDSKNIYIFPKINIFFNNIINLIEKRKLTNMKNFIQILYIAYIK